MNAINDAGKIWAEYDSAAEWCAKRGLKGIEGTPLPANLSASCMAEINEYQEAFAKRVRSTAYALAMAKHGNEP